MKERGRVAYGSDEEVPAYVQCYAELYMSPVKPSGANGSRPGSPVSAAKETCAQVCPCACCRAPCILKAPLPLARKRHTRLMCSKFSGAHCFWLCTAPCLGVRPHCCCCCHMM
jgi:hypothetical protein